MRAAPSEAVRRTAPSDGVASNPGLLQRSLAAPAVQVLAIALGLTWLALLNGFPLLTTDTGTYVATGFSLVAPVDRPLGYGLWLRFTTLLRAPWLAVVAQAVVVAWLYVSARRAWLPSGTWRGTLSSGALLAFGTPAAFAVGMIMPDVFTLVALLAAALIATSDRTSARTLAAWCLALFVALLVHLSHLTVLTGMACFTIVYSLAGRWWGVWAPPLRRAALLVVVVGSAWAAHAAINGVFGGALAVSRGSDAIYLQHLVQTGIARDVLDAECGARKWRLCADRGALPMRPDEFLWGAASPFARNGGWTEDNLRECREIVRASFASPRLWPRHAAAAISGGLAQLVTFDAADLAFPLTRSAYVLTVFSERYADDVPAIESSRLQRGALVPLIRRLDSIWAWAFGASLVVIAVLAGPKRYRRSIPPNVVGATVFVLVGLLANAIACGGLSTPVARYQMRVLPLAPVMAATLMAAWWGSSRRGESPGSLSPPRRSRWAFLVAALLGTTLVLAAFYPGYMSADSVDQLAEARAGVFSGWHPPVMGWTWRQLDRVFPGPSGMVVLQCATFWAAAGLLVMRIMPNWTGAAVALAWGLLPPVAVQLGTVWKDVQLATALLLAFALILRAQDRGSRAPLAGAALLLFYASAVRHNGLAAVAPLALWWGLVAAGRSRRRRAKVAGIAVGLLLVVSCALAARATTLALTRGRLAFPQEAFMVHDLVGISKVTGEGRLPAWLYTGRAALSRERIMEVYRPETVNPLLFLPEGSVMMPSDAAQVAELRRAWLEGVIAHPGVYLRHRTILFEAMLGWRSPPSYPYHWQVDPNSLGITSPKTWLNDAVMDWLLSIRSSILFRGWVYVAASLIGLAAAWMFCESRAAPTALVASSFCYLATFFFASPAPDFRYVLWSLLAATAIPFAIASARTATARITDGVPRQQEVSEGA